MPSDSIPRTRRRGRPARAPRVAAALVCALLAAGGLRAQERNIRFDRYTIKEGLAQSAVNCILQDRHGFMWFGTQDGLNRFDGYEFRRFAHDPDDSTTLSQPWVWACLEDAKGAIWVGTAGGGLNRLDHATESFTHFRNDRSNPFSLSNDTVRALLEDRRGRLWVGTEGGLNLLDPETGTFKRFTHNPSNPASLSHDEVRTIREDSSGVLWIGTYGGGLNRFDEETETFTHFRHDTADPGSLSEDRVRFIYEDRDGNFWIGTYEAGLNLFDRETGTFEHFVHVAADPSSLSDNRVRWILQDMDGVLWIGTDGGLNEWQGERRSFNRFLHNPTDPASLVDDRVMCIFQDRGGVLWVGTHGGLNKWNPTTGSFAGFQHDPLAKSTLSSNTINAFAEDPSGALWVGTYEGLNRLDRQTGDIVQYRKNLGGPHGLTDERVMTLMLDNLGLLWIGTYEGGLFRLDTATGRFTSYRAVPSDPRSLNSNRVTSIYQDREGVVWLGTYGGGLNRYDYETDSFLHYRHDPSNPTSISADQVLALEEDSQGVLWVGTDGGGLNGFDRKAGTFIQFRADPDDSRALTSDVVWALHEDRQGTLWLGTRGGGLLGWSPEDRASHRGVFKRYTKKDGLANDNVYGIEEDDLGNLWVSTNEGLSKFDPRTESFRTYDDTHGLLNKEFNFGAHLRSSTGEIMFGGNNGFNIFHPERLHNNYFKPPVVLTSVLKFNRKVDFDRPPAELEEIELSYKDSVFSFEFAALDYTAPGKNRYAYKLEGFDDHWIEEGTLRRATYTNLDPGEYLFRVKGSNNDGLWNEEGLEVRVRVVPPPWRTWWAYTLYLLAAAAVVLAYTRAQARKLEEKAEYSRKLEREVQARTHELAQRNEDLERVNNKLELASVTDSLTGLRNRRYLITHIERDIALIDRYHDDLTEKGIDRSLARPDYLFLIFDLDGFKEVNDAHGHAVGDSVLVQVRELLESACRKSDTLIRWGGDEFLVVGRYADRRAAEKLSERLRRRVAAHDFDLGGGQTVKLSCAIGFAYYPDLSSSPARLNWEQVVVIADRALYIAKKSGRDAWVGIYETADTQRIPAEELVHQINTRVESLVVEGKIELRTSIAEERELVWAWA